MSKHNFQEGYISGMDATDISTIPDPKRTHPMEFIEPQFGSERDEMIRGLAIGRRYVSRLIDWLQVSPNDAEGQVRLFGLIYALGMEYMLNDATPQQAAYVEGFEVDRLEKAIELSKRILEGDDEAVFEDVLPVKPTEEQKNKAKWDKLKVIADRGERVRG